MSAQESDKPRLPLSREGVRAWALRLSAHEPELLREVVHRDFNNDVTSGGFAFVEPGRTLYVASRNGSIMFAEAGDDPDHWLREIDWFWATQRHNDRPLDPQTFGPPQSAALQAALHGCRSVQEYLDVSDRVLSEVDRDFAERLLIQILEFARDPTDESSALRIFAANDWMLQPDDGAMHTHPCPICGLPAHGSPRYTRAVCKSCARKTTDSHGRLVAGYNTSLLGSGFEARFVNADGTAGDVCTEVTESEQCWIEGRPCSIGEARFGGVVVQALTQRIATPGR